MTLYLQPKVLFRTGYFPAAGAMTGVILEEHVKALCNTQSPPLTLRGNTIISSKSNVEIC